jgi:hypothetical protein
LNLRAGRRIVVWAFAGRDLRLGLKSWQTVALEE